MPLNLDLNRLGVAVCVVNVEGDGLFRFVGINDVAARETGLAGEAVAGRLFSECLPPDHARRLSDFYSICVRTGAIQEAEEELVLGAGRRWFKTTLTPLCDKTTGRVTQIMGVSQDITALKRLQAELHEYAYVDQLTGLPNRRRFDQAADNAADEAARSGASFSLAVIDLDELKSINDTHGHRIGDEVIRFVGRLLAERVQPGEIVARVGGDEFYLLLRIETRPELDERLDAIRLVVDQGLSFPALTNPLTLSVGGEIWRPGLAVYDVLAAADKAMYAEKEIRRLMGRIERHAAA